MFQPICSSGFFIVAIHTNASYFVPGGGCLKCLVALLYGCFKEKIPLCFQASPFAHGVSMQGRQRAEHQAGSMILIGHSSGGFILLVSIAHNHNHRSFSFRILVTLTTEITRALFHAKLATLSTGYVYPCSIILVLANEFSSDITFPNDFMCILGIEVKIPR